MSNGVTIIAARNSYYGRMAYNLLLSIKAVDPDIPVAVLHNGPGLSHLSDKQVEKFDLTIRIPDEIGGVEAKLYAYEYSPFARTLYIDADNAWMPKRRPSDLLRELEGAPFTAITEGKYEPSTGVDELRVDYTVWGNMKEIWAAYDLQHTFYQWRTEVMYFEKSHSTDQLFRDAYGIYHAPKTVPQDFAGTIPDEYAINIAASIHNVHPHRYKWQPAYWQPLIAGRFDRTKILNDYWILSTGGNDPGSNTGRLYTDIVRAAANKLGVQRVFPLQAKRRSMKERFNY